ncbi:MAG: hypothetical protein WEC75_14365 [Dehalococcoidia bacterium]
MKFRARSVGKVEIDPAKHVFLDHVRLRRSDFSRRELDYFGAHGSRLEHCTFEHTRIEDGCFGAGRDTSDYIECNFDGARIWSGGGCARFVRCSFRDVELHEWFCFATEFIDCTFTGRIVRSVFNRTVLKEYRKTFKRLHNEFHGNDFSGADLVDVGFRTGIDLSQQRLPTGPDYLYLPSAETTLAEARAVAAGWQDAEMRRLALQQIDGLKNELEGGQVQLLLRASDAYPIYSREVVDMVFDLLRDISA